MVSVAIDGTELENALADGQLRCPACGGVLGPWGFARSRQVRTLQDARELTPRRACCRSCATTHVLSPTWCVPRRRDGAAVIGAALLAAARGSGHRTIARELGRPPGTVRGWLRAARARAEPLRCSGTRWAYALDTELVVIEPAPSPLADAVQALATAARAWVLRLGPGPQGPWELAVFMTGGLLYGRPRDPP